MGISIWQLLIILLIVLLLFGAKKLRSLGTDLGGAVKGFREAMQNGDAASENEAEQKKGENENRVIEGQATSSSESKTAAKDQDKV
jgi:sec-independent protein translocase protein TatA